MGTTQKNLKLGLNTILFHLKDVEVEASNMCASKSDPETDTCTEPRSSSGAPFSDYGSITSQEPSSPVASSCSGSQRLEAVKEQQFGDLPGDKPPTGSIIEDKDGPIDVSWSAGSELHQSGQCRPCAWFYHARGCSLASACTYCHQCPKDQIRVKRKEKDAQLQQQRIEKGQRKALPPGRVGGLARSSHAGGHQPLPHTARARAPSEVICRTQKTLPGDSLKPGRQPDASDNPMKLGGSPWTAVHLYTDGRCLAHSASLA